MALHWAPQPMLLLLNCILYLIFFFSILEVQCPCWIPEVEEVGCHAGKLAAHPFLCPGGPFPDVLPVPAFKFSQFCSSPEWRDLWETWKGFYRTVFLIVPPSCFLKFFLLFARFPAEIWRPLGVAWDLLSLLQRPFSTAFSAAFSLWLEGRSLAAS